MKISDLIQNDDVIAMETGISEFIVEALDRRGIIVIISCSALYMFEVLNKKENYE
jgi:hypothetical protein